MTCTHGSWKLLEYDRVIHLKKLAHYSKYWWIFGTVH